MLKLKKPFLGPVVLGLFVLGIAGCANKDLAADDGAVFVEVIEPNNGVNTEVGGSESIAQKTRTRKIRLSPEDQAELARRGNAPTVQFANKARANYCPDLEVLNGTGVLTAYSDDGNDTAGDIVHQATITRSGRECTRTDDGVLNIRIGTAGRAVKGPKSVEDNVSLPIRIAILRNGEEVLFSQLYNQPIVFSGSSAQGFSFIEEKIGIPIPEEENIKIIVGFDTNTSAAAVSNTDENNKS